MYLENYGRDIGLTPYGFNIRNFLAYPHLLSRTSRVCQLRLTHYNQQLLNNVINTANGIAPTLETINSISEISNFVHLSSDTENDFNGYETCRDDLRQRYYILHREDQFSINHFGMCMPMECTPEDVENIINGFRRMRRLFQDQNINEFESSAAVLSLLDGNFPLRVYDSDVQNEDSKDIEFGHVAFWVFMGIFFLIVISGTIYHIYLQARDGEEMENNLRGNEIDRFAQRLIIGLSIVKAWERLLNTSGKYGANTLETLRGFKFIFGIWLAAGLYSYVMYIPLKSSEKLEDDLSKDILTTLGKSLIFLTDCLLWMSGVYTAYGFIFELVYRYNSENQNIQDKIIVYGLEILNKVAKLFILVATALFIFGWAVPTIGNGPVNSEKYYFMTRPMNDYWYTYLTFSNNFLEIENQGMIWGSFLATELQLFLCALPMIRTLVRRRILGM